MQLIASKTKHISMVLKKLSKEMLLRKYLMTFDKIGGNNIIVEVDETKIGRNKYNRGHHIEGV